MKTPVPPRSLTHSLEGLSLQDLTQSTPNQARMGESSINHEKALTLDEFLGHKGWPWRGSLSLPDLAACHPQVSVPQNTTKTSCTRFSWPSIQSCSPPPTSRSCPGRQLKRARGGQSRAWSQASTADPHVLTCKTRVGVREAVRPCPSLTTPVLYSIPDKALK